jgi:hypothetical protein
MFEFMAAGLPVVASNFPLWKRIVKDNKCGICVNPCDYKEVAKACNELLDSPTMTEEMGKNGRKAVENKYINRFGLIQIEFKSTNISRKHFNNGVRSFVPNTFDFYYDFFIVTWLYSDIYLKEDNEYHFTHWLEQQFFCEQKTKIE